MFVVAALLLTTGVATDAQVGSTPGSGFTTIIGSAMRYVMTYEHNLGNVARTINIPTLAMMFLHPRVNERFEFTDDGEETIDGRVLRRAAYREAVRPTPIKTTRRCAITVIFKRDEALDFWVPVRMDEYYKAALALDEIVATATYSNVRRFLKPSVE